MTDGSDLGAESCDFCKIARGESDTTEVVCEGDSWIAFFPLTPATPGHTLVIPRVHVADLWDLDPDQGGELMAAIILVGRAIRHALTPEGMNLITSAGKVAEQTVYHVHLHVVPRWKEDRLDEIWPPEGKSDEIDLDGVADRIREACHAMQ